MRERFACAFPSISCFLSVKLLCLGEVPVVEPTADAVSTMRLFLSPLPFGFKRKPNHSIPWFDASRWFSRSSAERKWPKPEFILRRHAHTCRMQHAQPPPWALLYSSWDLYLRHTGRPWGCWCGVADTKDNPSVGLGMPLPITAQDLVSLALSPPLSPSIMIRWFYTEVHALWNQAAD